MSGIPSTSSSSPLSLFAVALLFSFSLLPSSSSFLWLLHLDGSVFCFGRRGEGPLLSSQPSSVAGLTDWRRKGGGEGLGEGGGRLVRGDGGREGTGLSLSLQKEKERAPLLFPPPTYSSVRLEPSKQGKGDHSPPSLLLSPTAFPPFAPPVSIPSLASMVPSGKARTPPSPLAPPTSPPPQLPSGQGRLPSSHQHPRPPPLSAFSPGAARLSFTHSTRQRRLYKRGEGAFFG